MISDVVFDWMTEQAVSMGVVLSFPAPHAHAVLGHLVEL